MIVELVRASSDQGSIGFLRKKERLNVLLTRQQEYYFVVGDLGCTGTSSPNSTANQTTAETAADPVVDLSASKLSEQNKWVAKVFTWFTEHGRVEKVDKEALHEEYVTFAKEEEQTETTGTWGDATDNDGGEEEKQPEEKTADGGEEEKQSEEKTADGGEEEKQSEEKTADGGEEGK